MRDHLLDPHFGTPADRDEPDTVTGVASWIRRRAERSGNRPAIVHKPVAQGFATDGRGGAPSVTLTYAALHERATRLAHLLRADGVGTGDRVAYLGLNRPGFLEGLVAVGMLGGVFVPLNSLLSAPEIDHQLADCGARVLLCDALISAPALNSSVRIYPVGGTEYEAALSAVSPSDLAEPVRAADPCLILYTSGTTGRPKGAVLTHGNVLWNCLNVLVDLDLTGAEVALVTAPLFHAAALNMLALPVLLKGGTCLLAESFDASRTLDLIARHRVTSMFAVPTMLARMAAVPSFGSADLTSLRTLLCGGAPVPPDLKALYEARGVAVREGYGLTEASPGVLVDSGTGLVPHFFTDVRLSPLPGSPDGAGELLAAGPNVMAGYWGRPEETAAALSDGGLRTGDIARRSPDGAFQIVDRLKEVIISGGENIYPAEVERVISGIPGVAECAVIGVPHPDWGEVGHALLVPARDTALDTATVLASLRGVLATYKIPRTATVVPSLPRTRTGKLHRTEIRALYTPAQT
ncbi:fatty-acyl-CoA synthase [Actinocorallia herbida]|uniref:Fatty-acyl-CoA synthase n=1 Tax=Actinocorallia herbida TaxID=58109 RepID=A0A3N1CTS7_9ACTN|nr:AMP-binding protein [Actinocorallia herbida]ROO84717.1 fatty-acyl-CoA synthase [Actinocorallia herbida]